MTGVTFVKNARTPKLFGNFEFCKKQNVKNFTRNLIAKFKIKNLITEFFKKYFRFLENPRSFQGQGHFWDLAG